MLSHRKWLSLSYAPNLSIQFYTTIMMILLSLIFCLPKIDTAKDSEDAITSIYINSATIEDGRPYPNGQPI